MTSAPSTDPTTPPSASKKYADSVLADTPAAYYRLDDQVPGFAVDSSGNNRDGAHGADVTPGVGGMFPKVAPDNIALANDGPDWAFTTNGAGLPYSGAPRSLGLWFKTTQSGAGWLTAYGSGWGVYKLSGSALRIDPPGCCSSYDVNPDWSIIDGAWHQMVLTHDGNYTRLYLDGQLIGTTGFGAISSAGGLRVGQVAGTYDEVAVYDKQLSSHQIALRWATGQSSVDQCPVATSTRPYDDEVMADAPELYLPLSELSTDPGSRVVLDHSGKCRHATRQSSADSVSGAVVGDDDPALGSPDDQFAVVQGGDGLPVGSTPRSLELWFKTTQNEAGWLALYGSGWGVYKGAGSILQVDPPGCCSEMTVQPHWSIIDGSWHQLVLTHDGTYSRLYVDGQLLGATGFGGINVGRGLRVGQVAGSYDEISVYGKELSANQVADRWALGRSSVSRCPVESTSRGYEAAVLADAPQLYFPLTELGNDRDSRVVLDHAGHCRHATRDGQSKLASSGIAADQDPAIRSAEPDKWALFQGGDGLPVGSTPRSMELWFKTSQNEEGWLALYGSGWGVYKRAGSVLQVDPPGCCTELIVQPDWSIIDGSWHQLVLTHDGTYTRLYLDGQLIGSISFGGISAAGGLRVGQVAGVYDEISVYDQELSANRVAQRWAKGNRGADLACPQLAHSTWADAALDLHPDLYLRLGDRARNDAGRVAFDSSGHCRHATYSPTTEGVGTGAPRGDPDGAVSGTDGRWTVVQGGDGLPVGATPRSLEFWFNTTQYDAGWLAAYGSGWGVYKRAGSVLQVDPPGCCTELIVQPDWSIIDGSWHQIVLTTDGGTTRLFLDGQLLNSIGFGGISASGGLRIGQVRGTYDEVGVYGLELSAHQVAERWALGRAVVEQCSVEPSSGGYGEAVLADAPQLYLPMTELGTDPESRVVLDHSGHCRHASRAAETSVGESGIRGSSDPAIQSAQDGSWAVAQGGDGLPFGSTSRSLELWFNTRQTEPGWLVAYGSGWGVYKLTGSTLQVDPPGCCTELVVNPNWSVVDGSWHQLVLTSDGATTRLYVDGQLLGAIGFGPISTSGGLHIGQVAGAYDEVSVYSQTLTPAEVARRWAQGNRGPDQGCPTPAQSGWADALLDLRPELFLRLGDRAMDPVGRTAYDSSGHCRHATYRPASTGTTSGAPRGDPDGAISGPGGEWTVVQGGDGLPTGSLPRSLSMWFKTTQSSAGWLTAYGSGWGVFKGSGSSLTVDPPGCCSELVVQAPSSIIDGQWHQLALTNDGGTTRLYVDGQQIGAIGFGAISMAGGLRIGAVAGDYDEVVVLDRQLSSAEIADQYTRALLQNTTTTLSADADQWDESRPITLTATVTATGALPAGPTGTVTFTDGSTTLGQGALGADGTATITTSLTAGNHSVVARYSGDDLYAGSPSRPMDRVVTGSEPSSINVRLTPATGTYGSSVEATATVNGQAAGDASPTGFVTFLVGDEPVATIALAGDTATATLTGLEPADGEVRAAYGGDSVFTPTSATAALTISKPATLPQLTASPSPAAVGEPIVVRVRVPGVDGARVPGGQVEIRSESGPISTLQLRSDGTATTTLTELAKGVHSLTAHYLGDARYAAGTSETTSLTVTAADTRTSLTNEPEVAALGDSVVLTARVRAVQATTSVPTGAVTFTRNGTVVGTVSLDENARAELRVDDLALGTYEFVASYSGDDGNAPSTSPVREQSVEPAVAVAVAPDPSPLRVGQQGTLTATVVPSAGNGPTPTGRVTIFADGARLGTVTLDGTGSGRLNVTFPTAGLRQLTAAYPGNATYAPDQTEAPMALEVVPADTTTTLTGTPNPADEQDQVTYTSVVAAAAPGGGVPQGFVTFAVDGQDLATVPLNSAGKAAWTDQPRPQGHYQVTASYGGSANHNASASAGFDSYVSEETHTELTATPNPSVLGDSVSFTASVSGANLPGAPPGSVEISEGSTTLGSATLDQDGNATLTLSDLSVGNHAIVATYSGGSGWAQSTSNVLDQRVDRVGTAVTLTATPEQSVSGQPVTLLASITADKPDFGIPSGFVTFRAGTTVLGTARISGDTATLQASLRAGVQQLTATYGGDTTHASSTSNELSREVGRADVDLLVSTNPAPSEEGKPVTVTVTATPLAPGGGVPTGEVVVHQDGVEIATLVLSDGSVSTSVILDAGTHRFDASYAGDIDFNAATSTVHEHQVGHTTTTTLQVDPSSSVTGQPVVLTATVAATAGVPTGQVFFSDGTTTLGVADVDASGVGRLSTTALLPGQRELLATYVGDSNYAESTSEQVSFTVAPAATSVSVTPSSATSVYGRAVVLTADVAVIAPGTGKPSGFVSFSAGDVFLGTAVVGSDGTAALNTTTLPSGDQQVQARYGGSNAYRPSTGQASVQVEPAAVVVSVSVDRNPAIVGATITFDINVDPPAAGTPTGTVTLYDGDSRLGVQSLDSDGHASFRTSSLALGSHQVRAEYSGDGNFLAGASEPFAQQLNVGLPASVSLTSDHSAGTSAFGEDVTFTAAVTGDSTAGPTGFVTFTDNGQSIATVQIDTQGVARLIIGRLGVGEHDLRAVYGGDGKFYSAVSGSVAHSVSPLRQLFFVNDAQQLIAGTPSTAYTVQLRDRDGPVAVTATDGLVVRLAASSASGRFLAADGSMITSVTLPLGASQATFRYRDTVTGTPLIAVSAAASTGVGPRTQQQTVVPGPLDHLALTPGTKTIAPSSAQQFNVEGRDAWDNPRGDLTDTSILTIEPAGSCSAARCTVAAPGEYTVTATNGAASGTARLVADHAPVPTLVADVPTGVEDHEVAFTVGASDADGDALTWTLDFGDGSPPTASAVLQAEGATVHHTYLECRGCVAVLKVSDGKSSPVPNATVAIDVARNDDLFQANAGDPIVVPANQIAQLDGTASTPGAPMIGTYRWDFGDGTPTATSSEPIAQHIYTEPGDYVASLTVSGHGRTSTGQVPVTVTPPDSDGLSVSVSTDGQPLVGATVVVKDADNATYRADDIGDGGYRIDALPDGEYTAYAAAPGYLPATVPATVAEGTGFASVALKPGEVGVSDLTTRRLTPDEAIEHGIDPDAPGNQNIYQFEVRLSFEQQPIQFSGISTGTSFVDARCDGESCGGSYSPYVHLSFGNLRVIAQPHGQQILWIIIPGQAKWLKEMFDVQLMVTNLADSAFTFEDGTATLDLPSGVSLADMSGTAQSMSQAMEDVPGGESRSVHWIVRGDAEGFYDLAADYAGVLQPVGTPVQLHAQTDIANQIHVWGGSALRMKVDVDDAANAANPYDLTVSLTNVADVPIYNPLVTLLPAPQEEGRHYVFQPREQFDQGTAEIQPGATFSTRPYTVVPELSGALNLAQSTIVHTGGNQFVPSEITTHPAPDPATNPKVTATYSSGGVQVSWDPVPGAVGYQVFTSPFYWVDFPAQPLREVGSGQTSVTLPYKSEGYGLVAVSTLFQTPDGQVHNRLDHQLANLGGFAFDPQSACTSFGDAPNGPLAGNYVTSSEDLQIATIGPRLGVSRTYNSSSDRDGWFGPGWSSDYEMGWDSDSQGNVAVRLPDGRCLYFLRNKDDYASFDPPPGEFGRLVPDGAGGYEFTSKDRTAYAFDARGRLSSVTDVDGHRVDLDYEADPLNGRLQTVTDRTSGRRLTYTWSDDDHVASVASNPVSQPDGSVSPLVWRYYYDDGGRLLAACDPRDNAQTGSCTRYEHDADNNPDRRITKVVKPRGNTEASIAYDDKGRLTARTDGLGNKVTYAYPDPPEGLDGVASRMVATSPAGNESATDYDDQHRVVGVTTPSGARTTYEYDDNGYPELVVDPNGNRKRSVHDERGNVVQQINGEGETTWLSYDEDDNLIAVRDGRSSSAGDDRYVTRQRYDTKSHLIQLQTPATSDQPGGTTQRWEYTPGTHVGEGVWEGSAPAVGGGVQPPGLPNAIIDANGRTTTQAYDEDGDLRTIVSPSGLTTTYTYDQLGRRTSATVTDSAANPTTAARTTFALDAVGNIVDTTAPAVRNGVTGGSHQLRTHATYDRNDNLVEVQDIDIAGSDPTRTTTYNFDADDRITSVTDPEGGTTDRTYDADGHVATVTDAEGRVLTTRYTVDGLPKSTTLENYVDGLGGAPRSIQVKGYDYDAAGRVTSTIDANGHGRTYRYDKADRLISVVLDADQLVLEERTYDAAGQIVKVVTGGGLRTRTQQWDAAGRLMRSTLDPDGLDRTTTYSYDGVGNVLRQSTSQDGRTESVSTTYDPSDRPLTSTVENGSDDLVTRNSYDQRGNLIALTDPNGNTTRYAYDLLNRSVQRTLPEVSVETTGGMPTNVFPQETVGYDTFGDTTHTRDARGHVTASDYDRLGRQTAIHHPTYTTPSGDAISPIERFAYDAVGNTLSVSDRRAQTTSYSFDSLNRLARQTDPSVSGTPGTITYRYDDGGNLLSTVDQRGARVEMTYDDRDQLRARTQVVRGAGDPARYATQYAYDDLGNPVRQLDPLGHTTEVAYDAASEPISLTDATDAVTRIDHDLAGRVISTTDPLGRAQRRDYDLAGRLVSTVALAPSGVELARTRYDLDSNGNIRTVVRPRGNSTGFTYDSHDQLTKVEQPTSANRTLTTTYGYDAAGNLTRTTDGRGNSTTYSYNPWNLLEDTVEPATEGQADLASRTFTTTYDGGGLPVQETQPGNVVISRVFDNLGRLTSESGEGSGAAAATRSFGYDLAGNLTRTNHPSGSLSYTYDDRGLITSAGGPSGAATYDYDAGGRLSSRSDAAGTTSFTWTDRDELQTARDALTGATQTYSYDAGGQLASVGYSGGGARALAWDNQGRLTSDVLRDASGQITGGTTYGYDANDNVVTQTIIQNSSSVAGTHTYAYDQADRLVNWIDPKNRTTAYAYDDAGNRVQAGRTAYTFDERNRMTSGGGATYEWDARGDLTTSTELLQNATYTHDALGRLTGWKGGLLGLSSATYSYDGLDRVATRDGAEFSYQGPNLDPVSDGTTTIAQGPTGAPLAQQVNGKSELLGVNRHGDVTQLFGPDGVVSGASVFDPWGVNAGHTGKTSVLGFQGDWTDKTTSGVWMGARWYLPGQATFTARDTVFGGLQTPVSLNRYTYAVNNPLGMFDPDGHFSFSLSGAASFLSNTVSSVIGHVGGAISSVTGAVGSMVSHVTGFVSSAVATGTHAIGSVARSVYNAARQHVMTKIDQARRDIARAIDVARQASAASTSFVRDHADALRQGAALAVPLVTGIAATGVCVAATAGVATPLCMGLGGAAAGAVSGAMRCSGQPASVCARGIGIEAGAGFVSGLVGGTGGRLLTSAFRGGLANATYSSITQFAETGSVDPRDTLTSFAQGAVLTGGLHLGATGVARLRGGASEASAISPERGVGGPRAPPEADGPLPATSAGRASAGEAGTGRRDTSCNPWLSFAATTLVLMSDGSHKPIGEVAVGDEVIATDPETGVQAARRVTHVWVHEDSLIDLDVDGDLLTTTEDHPFWSVTDNKFERADELSAGERVLRANGAAVVVNGLPSTTRHTARAYNLSIQGIHTYHVGRESILVHNCGESGVESELLPALPDGYHYREAPGGTQVVRNPGRANDLPALRVQDGRLLPGGSSAFPRSSTVRSGFLRELAGDPSTPSSLRSWLMQGRTPPGYAVDHFRALFDRGADSASNMRLVLVSDHINRHRFYRPGGQIPTIGGG